MIRELGIKDAHSPSGGIIVGGKWFKRIKSLKKIAPGRFRVETYYHGNYIIEGGKRMGGSKTDWFLDPEDKSWNKSISLTSIVDGLNLIENM